jgi:hypothetical protein
MNARFCLTLVLLLAALVWVGAAAPLWFKAGGYLLIGWLVFLMNAASRMQIDWPATAATLVCLGLLVIGSHGIFSWLARQRGRAWALRWSSAVIGVMVLMFVAGVAMIGMTHQTGWLLAARQPLMEQRIATYYHIDSKASLQWIGMANQNYHDIRQELPQGGTSTADGTMLHSWMTLILAGGMMSTQQPLDYALPWDHPKNAAEFRNFVPEYLNPQVGKLRSEDGYALAHYAGNVHVVGGGPPLRMSQVTDGASHTMLAGEVAAEFKPWGYPMNWRDPAKGVNRLANGFASPDGKDVQFVFLDGSVRSFHKHTSPGVLRALATPRGGERVD